jgi:alpha-D-ribose 1-methylphosphonate 5-triphosphate synthase subunit PhnG
LLYLIDASIQQVKWTELGRHLLHEQQDQQKQQEQQEQQKEAVITYSVS